MFRARLIIRLRNFATVFLGRAALGFFIHSFEFRRISWFGGFASFGNDRGFLDNFNEPVPGVGAVPILTAMGFCGDDQNAVFSHQVTGDLTHSKQHGFCNSRR